jgi:hypothetical protein
MDISVGATLRKGAIALDRDAADPHLDVCMQNCSIRGSSTEYASSTRTP